MKVISRILKKILTISIMIIIGSLVPLSGATPSIVRQDNAIENPPGYLYEQLNTSQDQRLYREILDAIRLRSEKLIGVPSDIDDKHRIPACSSLRYDPYRLQGIYIEHYDRETLAQLLCRAKNLGFDEIELQFSDTGLYRKVFSNLLDQGVIFKIFEEHGAVTSTVSYATDEKRCILLTGIPDNYT